MIYNLIKEKQFYKAGLYYRLSDEDRGVGRHEKMVSDSIANQKKLITDFLKNKKEIQIVREYTDDGISGSTFSRPGFDKMMQDVENGVIDCIVVKDLSRFGREYIDAGNLLEKVFPKLGVRFIAINDNVDTLQGMDTLSIALKNIINDAYCRDISIKVRTNLEVKRNHGEFIGAFAVYGYEKNPENRHQLVIDDYAATVVQNIFMWKIQGMSCYGIAKKLNQIGILSPYEYKINRGLLYCTDFKLKEKCIWEASTVRRILENEIYTGTLVQGKWGRINHKIKKDILKDESEWSKVENTHQAIVSKRDFELVQKTLKLDTRTAPGEEKCYPLSGMVICGECGANMIRKPHTSGNKIYVYYECIEYLNSKRKHCSKHSIREEKLEKIVLDTIRSQIALIVNMDECMKQLDLTMLTKLDRERLEKQIQTHNDNIIKFRNLKRGLYGDLHDGLISKSEYVDLKKEFEMQEKQAEKALAEAEIEMEKVIDQKSHHYLWVENFIKYQNVTELSREMVLELVDVVIVHDKNNIEIIMTYQDEFKEACQQLKDLSSEQLKEVKICG